ncbi:hypothetical protein BB560_005367 [Smittium megazygosporum]|uniref:Uncharacterized protein n=1 Tax=Smittium megazygosporum TaxID=133381 RepID=A0A2T9Z6N3_9FUNG|nr:hypothetical protein BB560_005367 [Smittium megazygosporum]
MDDQTVANRIHSFVPSLVLNDDSASKKVVLLGGIAIQNSISKEKAILIIEKLHFVQAQFPTSNCNSLPPLGQTCKLPFQTALFKTFQLNSIFHWSEGWLSNFIQHAEHQDTNIKMHNYSNDFPDVKFTLIYPAEEKVAF